MAEYSFNNNNTNAQNNASGTPQNPNSGTGPQNAQDSYAAYAARYGTPDNSGTGPASENPVNGEYHSGYGGTYNPRSAGQTGAQGFNAPYGSYSYGSAYQNTTYQNNGYSSPSQPPKAEKKKNNAGLIAILVVVCILVSALSGLGGVLIGKTIFGTAGDSTRLPGSSSISTSNGNGTASVVVVNPSSDIVTTGTYSDVATAVKETVVEITTETVQTSTYFGQYITSGAGSGVIISADGLILTNYHVIEGATKITVRLSNGSEYEGTVTGSDSESDIALIKIDAADLKHPVIGNSDALVVGQEVVAIGNPLGELGGSVTNGIISALDREVKIGGETMNLLQTNAAVNPGNSGGGLFNLKGELIGVVNAKSSGTGIEGLGFAIPINDAMDVIMELSEYGYVRGRVYLGIDIREITEITMQYYYAGFTKPGMYVMSSPLNTEVKKYDRIVAADDVEVSTLSELKAILRQHKVGDTMTLTVVRNNKNVTVTVTCYEYVPDGVNSSINFEGSGN